MTFLTHGALPGAETVACAKSEFNIAQSRPPRDNDSDDDDDCGDGDDCGDDDDDDKEEEDNRDFEGFIINIIIQKQPLLESVNEGKLYSKSALSEFNIAQSHPAHDNDEDDDDDRDVSKGSIIISTLS